MQRIKLNILAAELLPSIVGTGQSHLKPGLGGQVVEFDAGIDLRSRYSYASI